MGRTDHARRSPTAHLAGAALLAALAALPPRTASAEPFVPAHHGPVSHYGAFPQTYAPHFLFTARGRTLHATTGGRISRLTLRAGEELLWSASAGRLGIALTDARVIGVTHAWQEWQTCDFRIHESEPLFAGAGDGFAVVVTDDRVVSLGETAADFSEARLGVYEEFEDAALGDRVAVVLTDKRALAVAAPGGIIAEHRFGVHERIESLSAGYDFAVVSTDKRLLVFDAASGFWQSRVARLR